MIVASQPCSAGRGWRPDARAASPLRAARCDGARSLGGPRAAYAVCRLLEEDPTLGECLGGERRERAAVECRARVVRLGRGRWDGRAPDPGPGGIGLLVLEGLLIRRVQVDGRASGELLGEGDLLCCPCRGELPGVDAAADWRVLVPVTLAVLDAAAAYRTARYPELTAELVGRALERTRRLAVNMAIVHHARIEARLELLFSQLAARWGRVRCEGVHLPLRLTHSLLADLVAAQRPSVTSALGRLAEQQRVRALSDGWLLAAPVAGVDGGAAGVTGGVNGHAALAPFGLDGGGRRDWRAAPAPRP
jgi:CRP/FNR family cyclic AMP-dependent transcriptional regulator